MSTVIRPTVLTRRKTAVGKSDILFRNKPTTDTTNYVVNAGINVVNNGVQVIHTP